MIATMYVEPLSTAVYATISVSPRPDNHRSRSSCPATTIHERLTARFGASVRPAGGRVTADASVIAISPRHGKERVTEATALE